jgi:transcriptional regulator with XRE-family HTH domain
LSSFIVEYYRVVKGRSASVANVPNLKRIREEYPLTVRELAQMSDLSYDTITKVENGHRRARPSTVRKLAKALGVEPRDLMKGE